MNVKKNILVPVSLLLLVVVIAVPAVLLFNGIGKFSAANQELKSSIQELRLLHEEDPFPSRDNILREKENAREIEQWFGRLVSAFQKGQITEEASTPTRFITQYGYTRNRLIQRAAKQKGMIPADFTFGFRTYAEGSLPAPVDVARLMQQLKMIEQLALVLIDAGTEAIVDISRDQFEVVAQTGTSAATTDSRRPTPTTRRSRRPATQRRPTPEARTPREESTLYDKQHFTLELKAKEATTVEILNQLARHDMFIVVNGVDIKKPGPDVRLPQEQESVTAPGATPAASAPAPVEKLDRRDLPRQQRRVSGPEFESPMTVIIELDVYTFTSETDG